MTKPDSTLTVMMDEATAHEAVLKINTSATSARVMLLDFYHREGWKALGYASFRACCEKEFSDLYGGKSNVYLLIQAAKTGAAIGEPELPTSHAAPLAKVEPSRQADVYHEAKKMGGGKATAATVRKAAAKEPAKKKKTPAPKASGEKLATALVRIRKVCGKKVGDSIENGILPSAGGKEAIFWAGLKDDQMADIEPLVVGKRWKPSVAWKHINKMVTGDTRLSELTNLAVAKGGVWEGTVDGFNITVKSSRKK